MCLKLRLDEIEVRSSLVDEVLVFARLDNDAVVDDGDDVGVDHGWETVSDQNAGSAFSRFVESILDDLKKSSKISYKREKITFSLSVSSALVASSRSRIFGFRISARAIAILCFCPPLSCDPFFPHRVSSFSGRSITKSKAFASRKASSISAWEYFCAATWFDLPDSLIPSSRP